MIPEQGWRCEGCGAERFQAIEYSHLAGCPHYVHMDLVSHQQMKPSAEKPKVSIAKRWLLWPYRV